MVLGGCQNLKLVLTIQRIFSFFCGLVVSKNLFCSGYFSVGFRSVTFHKWRFFLQQVAWFFFRRNSFNFQQSFWLVLCFWLILAFSVYLSGATAGLFWQSLSRVQFCAIFNHLVAANLALISESSLFAVIS